MSYPRHIAIGVLTVGLAVGLLSAGESQTTTTPQTKKQPPQTTDPQVQPKPKPQPKDPQTKPNIKPKPKDPQTKPNIKPKPKDPLQQPLEGAIKLRRQLNASYLNLAGAIRGLNQGYYFPPLRVGSGWVAGSYYYPPARRRNPPIVDRALEIRRLRAQIELLEQQIKRLQQRK